MLTCSTMLVCIVVDGKGRNVTGQAPQRVHTFFDGRLEEAHRAGIEVIGAEIGIGGSQVSQVEDEASFGETGDIGARNPEDIRGSASFNLADEHVLVAGGFRTTGFVAQRHTIPRGIDGFAGSGVDVDFSLVVWAGAPAQFNIPLRSRHKRECHSRDSDQGDDEVTAFQHNKLLANLAVTCRSLKQKLLNLVPVEQSPFHAGVRWTPVR